MEMMQTDIEAVLAGGKQDVTKALGADGEKKIRQDTEQFFPDYTRAGERILRNFVQFLKIY